MATKLTQSLDFRQQQNLVMTPQMQQAIKLLQLSNLELQDFLEEEIAQNPLLEKAEPPEPDGATSAQAEENSEAPDRNRPEEDFDAGSAMAAMGAGGRNDFSDHEDSAFDTMMNHPQTLRDHLLEQLQLDADDSRDRMIGALLIDRLDESGYLRDDPETLLEQLGCTRERLDNLLMKLKRFDPPRSLRLRSGQVPDVAA